MNDIQKDFETYFGFPYIFDKDYKGDYINEDTFYLWKGWQASHHKYLYNLVLELPHSWVAYEEGCVVVDLEFLKQNLDKVGVQYK